MYSLYTDGGCEPNPGHCASGAVLLDENEEIVYILSEYIGMGTNNLGELTAILHGIERAKVMNIRNITVYSDSELCVQLCSRKKNTKKEHLQKVLTPILTLIDTKIFESIEFIWVKGHVNQKWNEFADRLCTSALQLYKTPIPPARTISVPPVKESVIFLNCPFSEKDEVKQLGARWNKEEKKWYVVNTPENYELFSKWIQ